MIKNIIFDWGGVLASRDNDLAALLLSKKHNLNKEEFIDYFNENEDKYCMNEIYEPLLTKAENKFKIPMMEIMNALNSAEANEVYKKIHSLAKTKKLYILSNQPKYRADHIKQNNDLSFFTKVFFSCDIGYKKPDVQIFIYFLEETNLNPAECLFIDDRKENLEAAKNAGIGTYLFNTSEEFEKFLKKVL